MHSKIDATDPKNGSAPGGGTEEKNESTSLFCFILHLLGVVRHQSLLPYTCRYTLKAGTKTRVGNISRNEICCLSFVCR